MALAGAVALSAGLVFASSAIADPAEALPDGPKQILTTIAPDADALSQFVGQERTAEEWLAHFESEGAGLDEVDAAVLADYLALNAPAEPPGEDVAAQIAALPADGREMFVTSCQDCHGVTSYYLLQDRDAEGWMAIFDAPYHRRLLTEDNARETFSSYAAHRMPIAEDQIPEEWRD